MNAGAFRPEFHQGKHCTTDQMQTKPVFPSIDLTLDFTGDHESGIFEVADQRVYNRITYLHILQILNLPIAYMISGQVWNVDLSAAPWQVF